MSAWCFASENKIRGKNKKKRSVMVTSQEFLNYDTTRSHPECEVGNEESGGSTKRSRTTEEGDYCVNSNPDLPTSCGSTIKRPTGRDSAKKKGKGKAYNELAEELRAMRVTRDSEIKLMRKRVELEQQSVQYS
ncbi:hypothetical protein R6Q57_026162 [Mikania cordata]